MPKSVTRIAIYGDAGRGNPEQFALGRAMARRHALQPFDFALSTGDNQYDPTTTETMKSIFEAPFADLIRAGVPFYQTPGNHDMDEGRIASHLQYSRTVDAEAQNKGGWVLPAENYVIRRANVKVIVLNVTEAGSLFSYPHEALAFARSELEVSTSEWKILSFHYHLWSTGLRGDHEEMKEVFLPFLECYPIDFIFVGHEHHAEMFAPWKGIHYALIGHGSDIRNQLVASELACLFRTDQIGFAELSLGEDTARFVFIDQSGKEIWEREIKRRAPLSPLGALSSNFGKT